MTSNNRRRFIVIILCFMTLSLLLVACGDSSESLTIGASTTPPATTAVATTAPTTTSLATTAVQTTSAPTTVAPTTSAPVSTEPTGTQPPATTTAPAITVAPISITTPTNTRPISIAAPTTVAPVATNAPPPPATSNGNKLVFDVLNYQTNESRIFTISTDGSNKTDVGPGISPIFSPDGQQIAYLVSTGNGPANTSYTIYSMNLDGSNKQKYCSTPAGKYTTLLTWSPRSRFFALRVATAGTEDLGSIYTCSLSSKTLSEYKIGKDGVLRVFDWSPSGDDAVWMEAFNDTPDQEVLDLFYGDPEKTKAEATNVTNGQYKAEYFGPTRLYYSARISPDGRTILIQGERYFFVSVPGQQSPLAGQSLDPDFGYNFVWSPDSQSLAYVKPLQGTSELRIISVAGGKIGQPIIVDNTIAGTVDWARK